ncbi:MAG: hypothetical protein WCE61_02570 [Candidatus Acidiferrum sp.]
MSDPHAPASPQQPSSAPLQQSAAQVAPPPCIQPPPIVRLSDHNGLLANVVGTFARPLERKAVHPPNYRLGLKLCTLNLEDKFVLFLQDSIDPVNFLAAGFNAGLDQAEDSDPSYGQGAEGYGRRFGAELAGATSSRFFKEFAYTAVFREDPCYYRMAQGSGGKRLLHALGHVALAHRDNGNVMFNFSEWLGTSSSIALNNTFRPDNERWFAPAAERVGYSVLQDMGFDALREFWPEISRKFKLPFRGEAQPPIDNPKPAP